MLDRLTPATSPVAENVKGRSVQPASDLRRRLQASSDQFFSLVPVTPFARAASAFLAPGRSRI